MIDTALLNQDISAHVELIKTGQISAQEIALQQFECITRLNPVINAFISYAEPNIEPQPNNVLLPGVSIGIKDNIDVAGFATTAGMATRVDRMPQQDAFVVEKLREAGASFMGKLNMHEGALGATNQNVHFGDCHNPHRIGYTPGGSSGGSAAAVASGMVALALGSDTMGSVRLPASYCGIFGFKPSRGAVSNQGSVVCSRVMDNIGPMARSARDLTLAMKVMAKFDANCAQAIPYDFVNPTPGDNNILLVPENLRGLGIEEDIVDDFERNLDVFKDMGYSIQSFSFEGYDFAAARRAGLLICEADMRVEHAEDWLRQQQNFSEYMRSMLSFIESKSPMDIIQCERTLDNAKVFARKLFSKGSFLLMPTSPQRAFSFDTPVPANQADLTSFANQAGLPAASFPMLTKASLPAGMQIIGPSGSDFQILSMVERWQQVSGFSYSLPALIENV